MEKEIKKIIFLRFPKILLPLNSHPHEAVWPLSMGIMATILKEEGFAVKIIDLQIEKNFVFGRVIKDIIANETDILFIQMETPLFNSIFDFLTKLKRQKDNLIIIGFGQHASALPEEIIRSGIADICITTDAEYIVKDLIYAIGEGSLKEINNIVYSNDGEVIVAAKKGEIGYKTDELPFIDLSLLSLGSYRRKKFPKPFFFGRNWGFVRTSLGCPYKCLFCSPLLRHSISKVYRPHSIDYVVNQFTYYKKKFKIGVFSIEDDTFSLDTERAVRFCEAVAPLKIRWVVNGARADQISKPLLFEMKNAGCFGIGIGIESGSNRILNILKKGETVCQIEEAAYNIKKIGFILAGYIIIGNPSETDTDLEKTARLIEKIKPHVLYIHYFVPYPGSEAYSVYGDKMLPESPSHYNFKGSNLSEVNDEKLKTYMGYLYRRYYFSFGYALEYFRWKFKYAIFDPTEIALISEAIRFIAKK